MMKALLLLLCLLPLPLFCQEGKHADSLKVMWYNVENLFDTEDDPEKDDAEYLPDGLKGWTPRRYWNKLTAISRVIASVGEARFPDLVGLCEVENDSVLHALTRRSPLRTAGYRYLMTHSPDVRGVDVALLYLPGSFRPLAHRCIPVTGGDRPTRDILHVSGQVLTGDTLDLFLCHFPSRFGGIRASAPFRLLAARVLRQAIDSLHHVRQTPNLLVMGDFNDALSPDNPLAQTLRISEAVDANETDTFLYKLIDHQAPGSYAYQGHWEQIDHILLSAPLLQSQRRLHTRPSCFHVFRPSFLLTPDEKFGDSIPFRTHLGGRYLGGYSDHLPIFFTLFWR